MAVAEFGGGDYCEDKAEILSAFSASKDATSAGYLTSGAKKTFNLLCYTFTQVLILQYFDLE